MDNNPGVYNSQSPWVDNNDHVLVIYCSDPRFRQATAELLSFKGVVRYDQVVMPGGPAIILQASLTFVNDRQRIKFLCDEHKIQRVIAITHYDCAYYRQRHAQLDPAQQQKKQVEDLRSFANEIRKLAPNVNVVLFYASIGDGHVVFTQVG